MNSALGLPVSRVNLDLVAIALAIISGVKPIGVMLVVAVMIGIAATTCLLVKELH